MIKRTSLFVIFLCLSLWVVAQKPIFLKNNLTYGSSVYDKLYNIDGADMFFTLCRDTLFIHKFDKYKFEIPQSYLTKIEESTDSIINIHIETDYFLFSFSLNKETIINQMKFSIRLFYSSRNVPNVEFTECNKKDCISTPLMLEVIKKKKKRKFYR